MLNTYLCVWPVSLCTYSWDAATRTRITCSAWLTLYMTWICTYSRSLYSSGEPLTLVLLQLLLLTIQYSGGHLRHVEVVGEVVARLVLPLPLLLQYYYYSCCYYSIQRGAPATTSTTSTLVLLRLLLLLLELLNTAEGICYPFYYFHYYSSTSTKAAAANTTTQYSGGAPAARRGGRWGGSPTCAAASRRRRTGFCSRAIHARPRCSWSTLTSSPPCLLQRFGRVELNGICIYLYLSVLRLIPDLAAVETFRRLHRRACCKTRACWVRGGLNERVAWDSGSATRSQPPRPASLRDAGFAAPCGGCGFSLARVWLCEDLWSIDWACWVRDGIASVYVYLYRHRHIYLYCDSCPTSLQLKHFDVFIAVPVARRGPIEWETAYIYIHICTYTYINK